MGQAMQEGLQHQRRLTEVKKQQDPLVCVLSPHCPLLDLRPNWQAARPCGDTIRRERPHEDVISGCGFTEMGMPVTNVSNRTFDHPFLQESRAKSRKDRRDHRLDQLEIPATDVDITDEVLGRGGFGTVFLADFNGRNAAAKVVVFDADDHSSGDDDNDDHLHSGRPLGVHEQAKLEQQHRAKRRAKSRSRQRKAFMRELEAMKRLTGPHTVSIYGAITSSQDRLVLVMELLPGGDLRYRLRKARQPLDEATVMRIVKDVCSGMAFLHAKKTVHGDLKSANILFDTSGRAKVQHPESTLYVSP